MARMDTDFLTTKERIELKRAGRLPGNDAGTEANGENEGL